MRKKIILIFIILFLGILFWWIFGTSNTEVVINEDQNQSISEIGELNSEPVREFTVRADNYFFNPEEIRVKKGELVKIILVSVGGYHDLVIDEFDKKTNRINEGEEDVVEFVANKVGEFEYYCSVGNHRELGMVGKLIVEE